MAAFENNSRQLLKAYYWYLFENKYGKLNDTGIPSVKLSFFEFKQEIILLRFLMLFVNPE